MKNALISPNEAVSYISAWVANPDKTNPQKYLPVLTIIQNSARVAEVLPQGGEFPVAPPFFWVDCADNVVADQWYYDTVTQQIIVIPAPAPYPEAAGTTGIQTV